MNKQQSFGEDKICTKWFIIYLSDSKYQYLKVNNLLNLVSSTSVTITPSNYGKVTNIVWDTFVFEVN